MSQDLICEEIATLKIDAESSLRNNSSRIERVLNDGLPLFSEEVGSFSSNAEKFYTSTSNRETEQMIVEGKHYLNSTRWDLIDRQYVNVLKNLDSLTNIIFCIQKNYCDNIQYINISQSYDMVSSSESLSTRSFCINEASKDELLISVYRRLSILKPFVDKINTEIRIVPNRIITHIHALSALNELLPIWKININSQNNDETQSLHNLENVLSSVISIQLPSRNVFFRKKESLASRYMGQIDNNSLFDDLLIKLFFNCRNESNSHVKKPNLRAFMKLPESTSFLIKNNYQLCIKITQNVPTSKRSISDTKPKVDFPPCIKSTLAKQMHSILHKIHWILIDRSIFHIIMQQIVNIQKDSPEVISIRELDSEHIIFSINEANSYINNPYADLGLIAKDISISYRPIATTGKYSLTSTEINALKLLRETFLEVWKHSIQLNVGDVFEDPLRCTKICKYSNKLLEGWIFKLAKKCIKY